MNYVGSYGHHKLPIGSKSRNYYSKLHTGFSKLRRLTGRYVGMKRQQKKSFGYFGRRMLRGVR